MNFRRSLTITTGFLASLILLTANIHAASAKTHHHHHESDSGDNSSSDSRPSHHASRLTRLERVLEEQNDELYALRHERTALKERLHRHHTDSEADNSDSQPIHHKHHRHADADADTSQATHSKRYHHEEAVEYHEHLQRLWDQEAHEARVHDMRMHEIALAEAAREKHKDNKSTVVKVAASSGLPVWEGEAYAAQVPVRVVTVNLDDPRVRVSALLSEAGIGTSEPFSHMISRAHPYLAVTGTFFSLDNLRPVGDIVVDGSLAYFGGMGTALAVTPGNRADMITVPWGHHHDWSGYNTVVACGPRLLKDGQIVLDPRMEHFHDQHMLAPNSRIAVGITGHNQLVFCMTREPIYLGRLAKVMVSLGCKQAMNLDAGLSTGFYCNGNMIAAPGRRLTNAIVVYTDRHEDNISAVPSKPVSVAASLPSQAVSTMPSGQLTVVDAHSDPPFGTDPWCRDDCRFTDSFKSLTSIIFLHPELSACINRV